MNDFVPHIILGLFATNLPIIPTMVSYYILIFILSRDTVQARINMPSFASKDPAVQLHHFIAFILGKMLGFLIMKTFKL
jgi:hypothetical protein